MKNIIASVEILAEDDIQQIHQATLEVLAAVGGKLPNQKVLSLLEQAGAQVDYTTSIVKFPAALVERALRDNPRPEPSEKVINPGGRPVFYRQTGLRLTPGNQANIIDYQAIERRQGNTEDLIKGIVLCNELPYVAHCMPLVVAADTPAHIHDLYAYYLCTLYSKKPYSVYILNAETARQILRIRDIVCSEPARANDPRQVGFLLEPNGSLSYDEISLEIAVVFAEAGQEIWLGPMAMAGMDAPVTLPGALVIQNAENLMALVKCYVLGVPGGWATSAHTLDPRYTMCSFGSPNQVLLALAALQLGRFYGFYDLPVNCGLTDACTPDFQGGFEKGMSAMATLLAGASGVGAQGIVGADQGTSFEQLVIDNEWTSAIDHIFQHGFEVNPENLAVDVIKQVGIGGSYIAEEHTVRHLREVYWKASIFNQGTWDGWMADGGKDVYARAHERVEMILKEHYPPAPVISPAAVAALEALIVDVKMHPERFGAQPDFLRPAR